MPPERPSTMCRPARSGGSFIRRALYQGLAMARRSLCWSCRRVHAAGNAFLERVLMKLSPRLCPLLLSLGLSPLPAWAGIPPTAPRVLLYGEQHDQPDQQRQVAQAVRELASRQRLAAVVLEMAESGG